MEKPSVFMIWKSFHSCILGYLEYVTRGLAWHFLLYMIMIRLQRFATKLAFVPSTKRGPGLMNFFDPEESILAALVLVGVSLFPDSGIDFWGSQKSQKKHPINMIPWKKAFCYSSFLQPMIGCEKEFY